MKNSLWALLFATFLALGIGFTALTVLPTDAVACHPDCDDEEDDEDEDDEDEDDGGSRGSHG